MEQCAACRKEFEETKQVVQLCRNMPEIALPEGFTQRLHERLAAEAKPKKSVVFQFSRYKRSFAVGAAVIAASLVFVATPFFHLYQDSGEVSHRNIQDNQIAEITPESSPAPEEMTETVLPEQNESQQEEGQQPESPQAEDLPENIAGQASVRQENNRTPEQKTVTQPSVQIPDRNEEVPQQTPEAPVVQPQQTAGAAPAKQPEVTEDVPAPYAAAPQGEMANEIGAAEAYKGGGSGMVMAARGSSEPVVQQISASAENRAWLQENAAGYSDRQTVDGLEIVTLTIEEYRTLLSSNVQHETPPEVPQTAIDLMNADGYYVILK